MLRPPLAPMFLLEPWPCRVAEWYWLNFKFSTEPGTQWRPVMSRPVVRYNQIQVGPVSTGCLARPRSPPPPSPPQEVCVSARQRATHSRHDVSHRVDTGVTVNALPPPGRPPPYGDGVNSPGMLVVCGRGRRQSGADQVGARQLRDLKRQNEISGKNIRPTANKHSVFRPRHVAERRTFDHDGDTASSARGGGGATYYSFTDLPVGGAAETEYPHRR